MIKHPATNGCLMQRDYRLGLKDFRQQTPARDCLAIACLSRINNLGCIKSIWFSICFCSKVEQSWCK